MKLTKYVLHRAVHWCTLVAREQQSKGSVVAMNSENVRPETIIGKMIEEARVKRGYPVRALAREIDVSHAYVRDLTLGRRLPSEAIILKLCDELELDCDEMMMIAGRVGKSVYQHAQRSKGYGIFIRWLAELRVTDEETAELTEHLQHVRGGSSERFIRLIRLLADEEISDEEIADLIRHFRQIPSRPNSSDSVDSERRLEGELEGELEQHKLL